jgi:hypothetical protein
MENRPTTSPERQMPVHVEAAYKDAVDNIIFLKRQQWVATNYALLVDNHLESRDHLRRFGRADQMPQTDLACDLPSSFMLEGLRASRRPRRARGRARARVPLDISRGVAICWRGRHPNMTETTKARPQGNGVTKSGSRSHE